MHRYRQTPRTDRAARAEPNGLPLELCRVATEEGKAKYGGAQVATEDMLTPDLLSWTLGATVGIKYSKQFALNKQAQKVKYVATDIVAEDDNTTTGGDAGGEENGGGDNNPPGELEE